MKRIGKLYFRYGTMGSAKTAMLLTTAYNFEERGMAYRCFKPVVDTRDNKNVNAGGYTPNRICMRR